MKLTEYQASKVGSFLRESGDTIAQLSPGAKTQTLLMIRKRIRYELLQLGSETVEDQQLDEVLERLEVSPMGWMPPGDRVESGPVFQEHARDTRSRRAASPDLKRSRRRRVGASDDTLSDLSQRRCLGVCLALSKRHGYSVDMIRKAFLVAGVLSGPVALILYLTLYFERYATSADTSRLNIDRRQMAQSVAATCGVLVALFAGYLIIFQTLPILFEKVSGTSLRLGVWGRFENYNAPLLFGAFVTLLPAAVLNGLPIHDQSHTIVSKGLVAGVLLFAAILCYGIALCLTGVLIATAEFIAG